VKKLDFAEELTRTKVLLGTLREGRVTGKRKLSHKTMYNKLIPTEDLIKILYSPSHFNFPFYYLEVKIVGTSFTENNPRASRPGEPVLIRRDVLIHEFFENFGRIFFWSPEETLFDMIRNQPFEKVLSLAYGMENAIRIKADPKNPFDSNAIAVYVAVDIWREFLLVGYIPRGISEFIAERNWKDKFLVLGARADGLGMKVQMLFHNFPITNATGVRLNAKDMEEEVAKNNKDFLSLNELRRILEDK